MKKTVCLALATLALFAAPTQSETLIEPSDEAPQFRISNFRVARDRFGRPLLTADYVRTKEGEGAVSLKVMSRGGRVTMFGGGPSNYNQASGDIAFSMVTTGFGPSEFDYEIYLVVSANWAGKGYGPMLVSNPARLGNPGAGVRKRPWNDQERAAYEKNKLKDVPPEPLPAGYQAIDSSTRIANGMRLKAGYYGDWLDAELLNHNGANQATVRLLDSDRVLKVKKERWLAAPPEVLARAASDPASFSPSIRVLANGTKALPKQTQQLPDDIDLPKGAPLLVAKGSKWEEQYVVEDLGGLVEVISGHHRDFFGLDRRGNFKFTDSMSRDSLAITDKTLRGLEDPSVVASWADNLIPNKKKTGFGSDNDDGDQEDGDTKDASSVLDDYHLVDRSYPIEAKLPRRTQKVPRDVTLKPGSPVAYCSITKKWEPSTVVLDEGDTIVLTEDDSSGHFAYRLPRYQVIIENKTLLKLGRTSGSGSGPTASDLQKTLRTWTDSTGNHKVEARFVRVTGDKLVIRTDAGREITLPIARLSKADRKLVENLPAEPENPFE